MTTLNKFKTGQYKFDPFSKTAGVNSMVIRGKKPSLVLWDVAEDNTSELADALRDFINLYKPKSLMVAGSTAHTAPHVAELGANVFRKVWPS